MWLVSIVTLLGVFLLAKIFLFDLEVHSGLQVQTEGIPAMLFLDGQHLDKTPFVNKKIKPGTYILRIQPDSESFAPYELSVRLNRGTMTVVHWEPGSTLETSGGVMYEMELVPDRTKTELELQTIPSGAILTVNQGTKQFSPLVVSDLGEGDHEFEVSLPSYETQRHSIQLPAGHKVTATVVLAKATQVEEPTDQAEPTLTPLGRSLFGAQVRILNTNFFLDGQEVLRVRETASAGGRELGFVSVGESYPYRGESSGWLQIEFSGGVGWVSSEYTQKVDGGGGVEEAEPTE